MVLFISSFVEIGSFSLDMEDNYIRRRKTNREPSGLGMLSFIHTIP